uniref:Uncharacterized protein n=1 Tax=Tanacetum cinerariifolium TaxID=118510 RepID=A0A6L2NPU1_TANCI|nr:hypothetical protein [Tanacetum cinerariifolium]
MDMTIDQQVALDEALVPHASRLRDGKSNFRLRSDITSKESTLQVVYDVLKLTSFYKAFLVTVDVPEIYMQEFWATATVHHHSIRFKMNNKKRIVNLEYFREMLHICPRIPNQQFEDLLFGEEILAFLRNLGHGGEIKKITNEDFVYQVKHKDAKKSNKMYYPWFRKVIVNFFMTKDPSIPRRNKNTQQFGAILPVELINEDIRNSAAYKEYYAITSGAKAPKTKASFRKMQSSSDTTMPPHVALTETEQMKLATKRSLTHTHISQASRSSTDEGTCLIPGVSNVPIYESDEEISWKSRDDDDQDDEDDDQDNSDNDGNDDASHGMNVEGHEGSKAEDDDNELYGDVNINLKGRDVQMIDVHTTQIINEQVKEKVKVQVFKILPKIKKSINEQLEAEVLTRASNSSKTSYVVVADLSKLELKKILIEKMERKKSIHRSDEQKNIYKAMVDAYECDKIILDTYGATVTLKRRRDDEDKDEEPSAGSD